jgi:hypothetical protein
VCISRDACVRVCAGSHDPLILMRGHSCMEFRLGAGELHRSTRGWEQLGAANLAVGARGYWGHTQLLFTPTPSSASPPPRLPAHGEEHLQCLRLAPAPPVNRFTARPSAASARLPVTQAAW